MGLNQCAKCGNVLPTFTVKKDNANWGRPFVRCLDCDWFHWLDLPTCGCGEELFIYTVKKDNENKGRKFETCKNKCFFKWL